MIGIFDSGLGGLSVWRELYKTLPHEDIIYLADQAYCPYGGRPQRELIDRCEKITEFLLQRGCNLIIVACNTATAAAIDHLRAKYEVPFVGMEPAIKPAAQFTNTSAVGVLATEGTFNGRLFQETSKKHASHVEVVVQIGHGLVELVENGMAESPEAEEVLMKYIRPMQEKQVDHIVLGCTHYPFLAPTLKKLVGDSMHLLDPAPAVCKQAKNLMDQYDLHNPQEKPVYEFYTTAPSTAPLENFLRGISKELVNYPIEHCRL